MKYCLITGVGSGMGYSTAIKYLDNNCYVFGLDINNPNIKHNNFKFIKCDVTKISDINNAYEIISKSTRKLDTIINFAGIYNMDSLVEIDEDDFIKIFDINVFGIYRINKIFFSLLKENSHIFITSSELAPLYPLPFTGLYGISKSTIEKYAYSLRMELNLLNIKVIVIRPGAVSTNLLDVSTNKLDEFINKTNLYKTNSKDFKKIVDSVETKSISPNKIANLVFKIDNKKNPKYLYNINRNLGLRILNILPLRLQNYIIKKLLTKKYKK